MKTLKKAFALAIILPVLLITLLAAKAEPAKAVVTTNDLGNLVVLNGLFNNGWGWNNFNNLAGLIALNNVTGSGTVGTNDLGNLIVLNGLFNNGWGWGNNFNNLAGLIAVNNLLGTGNLTR